MDFLSGLNEQTTRSGDVHRGSVVDPGRRGQRQDEGHYAPDCVHRHGAARAALRHSGRHVHQQSRRGNARPRGGTSGGRAPRFHAAPFHVSLVLRAALAHGWRATGQGSPRFHAGASPSTTKTISSPLSRPPTGRWASMRKSSCSTARPSRASAIRRI